MKSSRIVEEFVGSESYKKTVEYEYHLKTVFSLLRAYEDSEIDWKLVTFT